MRACTLICPFSSSDVGCWAWSCVAGLLLELELCASRTCAAGKINTSKRARRRKEYIAFGIPPRHYGSTRMQGSPLGIKPSWGSVMGGPAVVWTRCGPVRLAQPYLIACRSVCNWASLNPGGDPFAPSQSCPSSVWASSQYSFQNASVIVCNCPQVMQVKPFSSYLGTKTQWPPQLPFAALSPPSGTTSQTSWFCAVNGSASPI